MEIRFSDPYLESYYTDEKPKLKKEHLGNKALRSQYIKTINTLVSIGKIEDLYLFKSLHYEKKHGDLKAFSAVWVNKQYRILFTEHRIDNVSTAIEIIQIEKLSKHYED
jgi:toxin HigB-1